MNGLATAWRTLTILPLVKSGSLAPAQALLWFPLVGLILGLIHYGAALFLTEQLPLGLAALILLSLSIGLNGGLHLDGLVDSADGLFALVTPERRLDILKDPRLGTFGGLALVLSLAFKWQLLYLLLEQGKALMLIPALVASRFAMAWMAGRMNYAREQGTARSWVNQAHWGHSLFALLAAACLLFPFLWSAAIALVLAIIAAELLGQFAKSRIQGITGDILGMTNELVEIALFFTFFLLPLHPIWLP